ncbi:hypothetical protein [Fodinibius salsisoli]|uniref:DUF4270 domain-containing protein n=1 Tax=Fodinibius salsisoli TaxID=2820877 RepID=A0ABT3PLR9_9BACT|nr:hypothetical protein [Fodinibius salsisoli]MCW9706859.1 hypothetical protein [Fodinibius salsisoli]
MIGCESPGSVGSGLTDSEADVVVYRDTVATVTTEQFNSYSGDYAFFSAGGFNDPLFGEMRATGMIKPALPNTSSDTLWDENTVMKMRILFDSPNVYGDTLADQSFDVYQIDEYWRRQAFKLQDDIRIDESQKVASFTVGSEDSLEVQLDQAWVNENYRPYTEELAADSTVDEDSLYANQEFGLALVPTNSNKIIPIDISSTRFLIEDAGEDTVQVATNQWAFFMSRNNEPALPEGSVPVHSLLESALSFNYDLTEIDNISGPSISRAELVFHQNEDAMNQTVSGSVKRPQAQSALLHLIDPNGDTLSKLVPGNPVANGLYSEEDQAFHFNVTALVQNGLINNGLDEDQRFYITLPDNGAIKSSLISGSASVNPPELVITYLKNSQ